MLALQVHDGGERLFEATAIAAAADGDKQAREWLVRRWTPNVWHFCTRIVGDEQDASELTQEILLRVLNTLDRYDRTRSFATWVFGIARNACIDEIRRRQVRRHDVLDEITDERPGQLVLATHAQRADALHLAMARIPPIYREILHLYHFEHLKHSEIAEILNLPMGTVMNRMFRARGKLRAALAEQGVES